MPTPSEEVPDTKEMLKEWRQTHRPKKNVPKAKKPRKRGPNPK